MNLVDGRKKGQRGEKQQPNHVDPVDIRLSAFRHMDRGAPNNRPGRIHRNLTRTKQF